VIEDQRRAASQDVLAGRMTEGARALAPTIWRPSAGNADSSDPSPRVILTGGRSLVVAALVACNVAQKFLPPQSDVETSVPEA
jgi:hypothetical protein